MMKWYIYLGLILSPLFGKTQPGFIRAYDFDRDGTFFGNIAQKEDTIVICGLSIPEEPPITQGIRITKIDTFGNILDFRETYDSTGLNYAFAGLPNGFLELSNNEGYLVLGNIFELLEGAVFKFDVSGNLLWRTTYPDPSSIQDYYRDVIEVENGYLIVGSKTKSTGRRKTFLMKIDKSGKKLWEKSFNSGSLNIALTGILKQNENEILLYGEVSTLDDWQTREAKSKIVSLDSLGNVRWEWESPFFSDRFGIGKLHRNNADWVITSSKVQYEFDGFSEQQPILVIRDSAFNIKLEKSYAEFSHQNIFRNLIPVSSGGWLGVGGRIFGDYRYGWMVRINGQGDTLWNTVNLAINDSSEVSYNNILLNAVELSSGSIIASGYCEVDLALSLDRGWLIKVDKNGCVDTLMCNPISPVFETSAAEQIKVYPNPVTDQITVELPNLPQGAIFELFNAAGKAILRKELTLLSTEFNLNNPVSGIHFYRISKPDEDAQFGRLIIR